MVRMLLKSWAIPLESVLIASAARLAQALLQLPAQHPLFGLGQRAAHRRNQPGQAIFQDVIGGAVAQRLDRRFLTDRARNKNKGYFRFQRMGNFQRMMPLKPGSCNPPE